ncbi:zinc finger protein 37-like isoform X2 [Larimichthys crocea]|uniref:zinc finger protein 37-like isoform X2 n=1 Tax=Larimichthys crocea TaxID=215358 RepID=UPI000F5F41ED|nr:zinc finger protein 37-like isoform X2 [Larimichthys crocea]
MSSPESLREFVRERLTAAAEEIFGVFQRTVTEYEAEIRRQRRLLDAVCRPEVRLHRIELPQQHVCQQEETLTDQERSSREPPHKEEVEEVCSSQPDLQPYEKREHTESQSDEQPLFDNSDEGQSTDEVRDGDEDSTQNAAPKPKPKRGRPSNAERHRKSFQRDTCEKEFNFEYEYEEETDQQRELLDVVWKPELRLHRIETLTDQERSSREPPHKEEVEEVCSSQPDLQPYEKREHTESQSDEQPLFDNSDEAQSKDEDGDGPEDSKTRNAALKPKRGRPPNAEKHRKSFQCDTCGKECKSKYRLDNHLKMHTNGVKLWWCNICGKGFGLRSALNDHIKSHPGEGQYFCSTCGKGFTYRSHLSIHARTHRGLKLHLCKRCGKPFAFDSALKVHMRTHTDERPHTCKTCGKGFRALSSLEIHMRTHTDERPFLCKTCGKGFRQRAHLTAHLSTHTGEKPYPCDVCGKNYGSLSILSKHRKMHAKSLEATVDQRSMPTAPVNMASVILSL